MKNFKAFLFLMVGALFITGCQVGVLPTDEVGLPAAFAHCAHSVSYWVWGIIATLAAGFAGWRMKKAYDDGAEISPVLLFGIAVVLLLAWCYRPSELAWNTTVEQAARGVWIGY